MDTRALRKGRSRRRAATLVALVALVATPGCTPITLGSETESLAPPTCQGAVSTDANATWSPYTVDAPSSDEDCASGPCGELVANAFYPTGIVACGDRVVWATSAASSDSDAATAPDLVSLDVKTGAFFALESEYVFGPLACDATRLYAGVRLLVQADVVPSDNFVVGMDLDDGAPHLTRLATLGLTAAAPTVLDLAAGKRALSVLVGPPGLASGATLDGDATPKACGGSVLLARGAQHEASVVAILGTDTFAAWSDAGKGTLARASAGAWVELAHFDGTAHRMVADATALYLGTSAGVLRFDAKGGATTLVTAADVGGGLAVGGGFLYWTSVAATGDTPTLGRISRVPVAGGAVEELATDGAVEDVAVTSDAVYWVSQGLGGLGEVRRIRF